MRRALSQARRPAPVVIFGNRSAAEPLARALDVAEAGGGAGPGPAGGLTHGFHASPARMHPLTARRALVALGVKPGATVLDPFCGSGTVLVEAFRAGARAIGVDASPLAVEIAFARTWRARAGRRRE